LIKLSQTIIEDWFFETWTSAVSAVKSLLLLWKPHSWFSANLKTFYVVNYELNDLSLAKISSKRRELLKLCHINHMGLGFFSRHSL